MNRREFLRAAGAVAGTAGALSLPARAYEGGNARSGVATASRATGSASVSVASSGHPTADGTAPRETDGTPTPTPTPPAATPTQGYDPLGGVEIRNGAEAVVTPDGETAFVAVGDGFASVDISDPARPAVLGLETGISPPGADAAMGGIRDVKYGDGRLLVAGPAHREEGVFHGVALFDVTDPTEPGFLRAHATMFPVHNCYFDGRYAYLTGNDGAENPLVVVDVTEGREIARWSIVDHDERWADVAPNLRTLHDVWVQDDLAYLAHWDAGTWILDVSEPADPAYVANVTSQSPGSLASKSGLDAARASGQPPGNDHYVATDGAGRLLGIGKESWDSSFGEADKPDGYEDTGGPSGIHLYDVADPANPGKLAEIDPPPTADPTYAGVWTTAHNFDIHEGYLYSSWYRGGVRVHDVSDPREPREIAHFRRSRTTSFWTAQLARPGEFFVAMSHENPRNPAGPGTLYAFPDPRETPTPTPAESPATTTEPRAGRNGRGSTLTGTPTRPSPTPAGNGTPETAGEGGPGFGPLAALAALGVGAWRLLGRERGEDGGDD